MLGVARLTNGIGARIVHNTPCMSIKDAQVADHILVSVNNAKQKKTTKTAHYRELAYHNIVSRGFLKNETLAPTYRRHFVGAHALCRKM
jgi:hypothetical protein